MRYHLDFKPLFIRIAVLLLSTLPPSTVKAQFVDLGQDPCFTRWRQIKTDEFQIIYPDFFEEQAQYIANIYAKLYAHGNSLGIKAKKISMIVRANGGISNGNAGWAPKKSELYTTPPQSSDDNWLEHLCVHEFRHVIQYDKVNQGFSKVLYYIFGEQMTMAIIGLYIPMWYLEGDATDFETSIGTNGRGRSPEFLNEMKAQIVEKGLYSYDKAVLGSLRDFVPDRYTMGYFMAGNSRVHYGNAIWQDALARVGKRPYGITPFARSLKITLKQKRDSLWALPRFRSFFVDPDSVKQANTYCDAKRTLYRDNFSELQQLWKREADSTQNHFDTLATRNPVYANYHYPTPAGQGEIIAYKQGLNQAGAFVRLKSGEESILIRPGVLYDYKFAYNQHKLVWSEYKPNLRWQHGGKMVLASFDMQKRKYTRHPASFNRFAPFAVGKNWGFVEVNKENQASIVITDHTFKKELFRLKGKEHELFVHPSFDGKKYILTVVVSPSGKRLERIDLKNGKRESVTPETNYELDNPIDLKGETLYRAAFNGNNSFYRQKDSLHFGGNILNGRFGIRYPALSPQKDTLYFSFYTADGYKPGKIALQQLEETDIRSKCFPLAEELTRLENWKFKFTQDSVYKSKKYNKALHLFNFHSWGPIFPDKDDMDIDFGIAVSSQNKLSTLFLTAGYVRGRDYPHGNWQIKATYKGFWPVFQVEFKSGRQDDYMTNIDYNATNLITHKQDTVLIYNTNRYTQLNTVIQFPFTLNIKNVLRTLTPYVKYELKTLHQNKIKEFGSVYDFKKNLWQIAHPNDYQFKNPDRTLQIMQYGIIFYNQTRMNARDINPRWGQRLEAGFAHTPFENLDYGNTWWGEGRFYFPGFVPHHSFYAYLGHQEKSNTNNYFSNEILSPRGMTLRGHRLSTLHSGYKMPVCYPDAHVGPVLYMKRLTAGVFFDAGKEKNRLRSKFFYSYGIEATVDSHFFRLPFPVNLGFRTGYETKKQSMFFDFLFSVALTI
ncbi:hypothetical protein [Sanguibacteroides justesenii]|uniref:Bacterial surface antigen (D15) domain-containing protein n=1 Tax=Sanguibacteroides justesenii TaxID=1547597 RepID=A0AB34R655_9PORP|nr:hypothetical protein [Sanguibacteroides justesenii]KIO46871.1 hypothetical protein IE90_02295 [Sanguibacteroides justesenii]